MTNSIPARCTTPVSRAPIRRKQGEDGYILLGVLILLAIFIIAMAVAAPKVAYDIQRDREIETMRRGKQYIRAVQLYYRKFNAYPPNVDALVKTSEIRFLRKRYVDPITGKDDWKPILFGQNKAPIAMGFFGQALGGSDGSVLAGTGPSGGNGLTTGSIFNQQGSAGSSSATGTSILGSPTTPTAPTDGSGGATGATGTVGATTGTTGTAGTAGTTDANGNPTTGDSGATMGGAGIIGFSPASDKKSILVFKKKDHYNQWEFTYSPMMDMQTVGGGNTGTVGAPVTGTGTGTGTGITPSTTIGPTTNGGGTPTPPPTDTPPPQ